MNDAANRAGAQALAALHEAERRAAVKKKRNPVVLARCVYCGDTMRTSRVPPTCVLHRDLPALDPHYS